MLENQHRPVSNLFYPVMTQEASLPDKRPENVAGLRCPHLDEVRIGLIGAGSRGTGLLRRLIRIEGVAINAVSDASAENTAGAAEVCREAGLPRPDALDGEGNESAYLELCDRSDVDLVLIATPWEWHTPMAVAAMERGCHVVVEVPAAVTAEECWQLVETAERTRRHCMMLENVCYGRSELMVLNMVRQGLLGELLHGEAAYIHDLRKLYFSDRNAGQWRTQHNIDRNGNLYPTHGLGPVAQYMNINRGDRFDYLVSMSSNSRGLARYAQSEFGPDDLRARVDYGRGDMNSSLIRTHHGLTILLQHDTTSPRPYSRLNLIQGTAGTFAGFPDRIFLDGEASGHEWNDPETYRAKYEHPLWKRIGSLATSAGGHGGMDFIMLWRLVDCLRRGLPLDMDVYDAASWSVVSALTEQSVAERSQPVDFPDFTRGSWESNAPLGVVE